MKLMKKLKNISIKFNQKYIFFLNFHLNEF